MGLLLFAASPAQAQNCYPAHSAGFSRLRALEYKATTQGVADLEVRNLFGPRIDLCEEGAYKAFMESFYSFAHDAMRPPGGNKAARDKLLRLAIAVLQQAPTKVPAKEERTAASQFKQVRSDLNSTADDVGFATTPLLQQLMDALGNLGAPRAAEQAAISDQPPQTGTTTGSGGTTGNNTQSIRVPTEPLPPWAVVKLYEMRDHIKSQDLGAIQIRLQDIINWIESKTRDTPQ
jgi:hypothetical protein